MNELEEKVYNANKTSLELLKQLKDSEDEIDGLKHYILELKSRMAVYIPFTEDEVDVKLAEFINNYPERSKLKIMFLRESQGVYQFGSRRIAVKVERDKINSKLFIFISFSPCGRWISFDRRILGLVYSFRT
jgi:hypothetical protein